MNYRDRWRRCHPKRSRCCCANASPRYGLYAVMEVAVSFPGMALKALGHQNLRSWVGLSGTHQSGKCPYISYQLRPSASARWGGAPPPLTLPPPGKDAIYVLYTGLQCHAKASHSSISFWCFALALHQTLTSFTVRQYVLNLFLFS